MASAEGAATRGLMSSPLAKKTVLITRPSDSAASIGGCLRSYGATILSVPMIRITASVSDREFDIFSTKVQSGFFGWIVFTSANGVKALDGFGRLPERRNRIVETWLSAVKVAAVGPRTAATVASLGFTVNFCPKEFTSAALVESFPPVSLDEKIAIVLGNLSDETVKSGFISKGCEIECLTAYRTEPVKYVSAAHVAARQKIAKADFVLFFSPSAVRSAVDSFGSQLISGAVVCVGPKTALAAEEAGLSLAGVAEQYSSEGVAELVLSLASS